MKYLTKNASVVNVIAALESTSKKLEKKAILTETWEAGCTEFFDGAIYALNNKITYGIKVLPTVGHAGNDNNHPNKNNWENFKNTVLIPLSLRKATGSGAKLLISANQVIHSQDVWDSWFSRIIKKDLRIGVSEKTINEVLKKIGKRDKSALKYLIPVYSPQLAHIGENYPKQMNGKKFVDLKLDGARLNIHIDKEKNEVRVCSRNGLPNDNFPTIAALVLKKLEQYSESTMLDGEIMSASYNELMTQWRRKGADTSDAYFVIFDAVPLAAFDAGICDIPQKDRNTAAENICEIIADPRIYYNPKILVDLDTPEGQVQMKEFGDQAVKNGFEGIMIKDPMAGYVVKKSTNWLKWKPTITVDLRVVGFENGKAGHKHEHVLGNFVCDGVYEGIDIHTDVGGGLSDKQRQDFWDDQQEILGHTIEILADAVTTNKNGTHSLRFGRFVRFRPDKD